jgi:hypothetical protein
MSLNAIHPGDDNAVLIGLKERITEEGSPLRMEQLVFTVCEKGSKSILGPGIPSLG